MVKLLAKICVAIIVFGCALYIWVFQMIWTTISFIVTDFLPYIPMEIRLGLFMVILALTWALINSFID